jgi:hypothetical protein
LEPDECFSVLAGGFVSQTSMVLHDRCKVVGFNLR